jgi:hypothetical protein
MTGVSGVDIISSWLSGLTPATNSATNTQLTGTWVELVKVKKWYSLRLMKWDATNKRKEYVKYIGTLANSKKNPVYAEEAHRLEAKRFAVSGGTIVPDTGAYQPHAEYLH